VLIERSPAADFEDASLIDASAKLFRRPLRPVCGPYRPFRTHVDMTMDVVFNWGDPVIGVHRTYLSNNI
jgi:hypothetical protein